jgi:hypothetical protein
MRRICIPLVGVLTVACGLLPRRAEPLRVQYVRFDPAPQLDGAPSTVLNFGLSNEGSDNLTNIVVKVSILEKPADSGVGDRLAGPYMLVGKDYVLRPGQMLAFEIRLRNLSSDCQCVAHVNVLSAHSTQRTGKDHDQALAPAPKAPEALPESRRL